MTDDTTLGNDALFKRLHGGLPTSGATTVPPADDPGDEQAAVRLEQIWDRETTTGEFSGACSDDAEILDAGDDQTLPNNL